MTLPAWFWPPSGGAARSLSLQPFGTAGMAAVDWTTPTLWELNASGFTGGGTTIGTGQTGFSSSAHNGIHLYTVTWDGHPWDISSFPSALTVLPSGQAYVGTTFAGGSGIFMAASGQVYNGAATHVGNFALPAKYLTSSGSTLVAAYPASGIGTMNVANGATGFIALPVASSLIACLACASGMPVAVGGWSPAPALLGAAAAAMDPQNNTNVLAVGSGNAILWASPNAFSETWAVNQSVSGLASLVAIGWRPDGTQALAPSLASGVVQVLNYTAGVLSAGQVITPISGACSVAIIGASTHALVAQSGQAQAANLSFAGSTWSVGTPVTGLTGITAVAPFGSIGVVAAVSGGLAWLENEGGIWQSQGSASLGFTPTCVTVDSFGQFYAAGSGAVALFGSNMAPVASGSWTGGTATSVVVQQGRIIIATGSDQSYRVFGLSASGTLTQQNTGTLSLGASVGLALSETTLFALGSGATHLFGFSGTPYALTVPQSGFVSFWNGSTWATLGLGIGNMPSAIGLDASGGVWATTIQNNFFHIASGASLLSSGVLQAYPGQSQTTPLTPSSVLVTTSGVFITTSIPGVLGQIA